MPIKYVAPPSEEKPNKLIETTVFRSYPFLLGGALEILKYLCKKFAFFNITYRREKQSKSNEALFQKDTSSTYFFDQSTVYIALLVKLTHQFIYNKINTHLFDPLFPFSDEHKITNLPTN